MEHDPKRSRCALQRCRSGAVAIHVALVLVGLVGFVSLGSEIVLLLATSRQMQSAADAAALAGVSAELSGRPPDYTQEVFAVAGASGFVNNAPDGTLVEIHRPPTIGYYTTDNNAIEVLISQPQSEPLSQVVYPGPFVVRGRAVASIAGGSVCALALDPNGGSSFSMSGSTTANFVDCDIAANSGSAQAVSLTGGATINTSHLFTAGGYTLSGGSAINAATGITTNGPTFADPYAAVPVPPPGACLKTNYKPATNATITPGTYCNGISLTGGVSLTLTPGIYILDRGTLNMSGGSRLSGTGVTIVLTSRTGSNYANVSVSGGSIINLTAPNSGPTAGLAFFQDRAAPTSGTSDLSGGSQQLITGALYFPTQTLNFSGGSGSLNAVCTQLIAWHFRLSGNATVRLSCAGTGVQPVGGLAVLLE